MRDWIDWIEVWLKRAIVIQLVFLIAAQFLLQFDRFIPYLNKAVANEGVIHFLQPAAKSVFQVFDGF